MTYKYLNISDSMEEIEQYYAGKPKNERGVVLYDTTKEVFYDDTSFVQ